MTAPVLEAAAAPAPRTATPAAHLTFVRVLRAETIKLVSLRSTWWSIGITAVLSVGISALMATASRDFPSEFPPVMAITAPMQFTMLLAGILGAISVTGEYSTGMIRSTLTAVPRRGEVLAAKAVVVGGFLAIASAIIFGVAVLATAPILASPIDWSEPAQSIVPIAYSVMSMTVFALIGVGFGFILRSGAGAIAATVGVLFVLPIVVDLFRLFGPAWAWVADLGKHLPMSAAQVLTVPGAADPGTAVLTLAGWVAVCLAGAWAVLRVRDA